MGLTKREVARLRKETPGCARVVHFNHAGASLMPRPVLDTMIDYLWQEAEIGAYEAADGATEQIQSVYQSAADLIGAVPAEIALIENATRAWDMAFYSLRFQPGDRILTSMSEYASNVIAFLQVAQQGVQVEVVPNDATGQLSISALANMIDARCKLVAVSHMPTNGGLVQPVEQIGALCRAAGVPFLLDACQTAGQMPLDVAAIGCDMLSATSRKYLRGPRGCGFLYVRGEFLPQLTPPMLDLHAASWTSLDSYEMLPDARRFENWEKNLAGFLGMGVAIDYARQISLDRTWQQIQSVAAALRRGLTSIPGVAVRDLGEVQGGIVTFTIDNLAAETVVERLHQAKINTVSSSVFSTRYDMEARGLSEVVRASVHYFTTGEEVTLLLEAVDDLARCCPR